MTSQLIDADMHEQVQCSKLAEWREVTSRLKAQLKETGEVPRTGEMEHLIDLIGAIFFSYGLKHVGFYWKKSKNAFGRTISGRRPGELDDWVEIQIDPRDWHVDAGTPDHFTRIISTLLHECVHASLKSYTCDTDCQDSTCATNMRRSKGGTSHGSAFFRIMTHVQACAITCTQDGLDLNAKTAVWEEWKKTGIIANEAEIALCHPQYQKMMRTYGQYLAERDWRESESENESESESEEDE